MIYDLHSHSYYSDGEFSPAEVLTHAKARGVQALALTDHDTVKGLAGAKLQAQLEDIHLIPGTEISARWKEVSIHIIALQIDSENEQLLQGLDKHRVLRQERIKKMDERFADIGIEGVYDGACAMAKGDILTRPHMAHYLIQQGHVKDFQAAFNRYLTKGKPTFVPTPWTPMEEVIQWITAAGGFAIVAHPVRYKLTKGKLQHLLHDFKDAGGVGIEVVTSRHDPEAQKRMARYCAELDMYGSAGSDFHGPSTWAKLGNLPELPSGCRPIWQHPDWALGT